MNAMESAPPQYVAYSQDWVGDKVMAAVTMGLAIVFFIGRLLLQSIGLLLALGSVGSPIQNETRFLLIFYVPPLVTVVLQILGAVWILRGRRIGFKLTLLGAVLAAFTGFGWGRFDFNGLVIFVDGTAGVCGIAIAIYSILRLWCRVGPRLP
jgi:hypothetical protein